MESGAVGTPYRAPTGDDAGNAAGITPHADDDGRTLVRRLLWYWPYGRASPDAFPTGAHERMGRDACGGAGQPPEWHVRACRGMRHRAAETRDGEGHRLPERGGRDGDFQRNRDAGRF